METGKSQIVIENEGIAQPLLVNRATDTNGQPWADGNVHADKVYLPTKTDAVTDADGNTLAGQLFLLFSNDSAVCATAAATAAKVVSLTGFELSDGKDIVVSFTNANTADNTALSLNVSGTGAFPIRNKNQPLPTGYSLYGEQRLTFRNNAWNIEGDINIDTNTTYPVLDVATLLAGTDNTLRTVRADYLNQGINQMAQRIADSVTAGADVSDIRRQLSDLRFQLIVAGIIGDYDTAVRIDDINDITLISGMFDATVGGVYI